MKIGWKRRGGVSSPMGGGGLECAETGANLGTQGVIAACRGGVRRQGGLPSAGLGGLWGEGSGMKQW